MPIFERDTLSLYYEISGAGPPLLMIAGMMSDSASWAPLIPLLEPHFTLICPDNRTTGRTTPWDAPASVDLFASDCAALLKHLEVGPAHVLGHSLGGMIGMRLACKHPSAVKTLTLAASAPLRLERNVALFKALLAIRRSDAAPDAWLNALFPWLFSPALYEIAGAVEQAAAASLAYPFAQSSDAMAHQIDALDGYTPELAASIPCPTQALLAKDDLLLPYELAQPTLGGTAFHSIENAGHSIHWDAADEVAKHVKRFITQHEGANK
ncbi:alpha/beta fold hydrolase [Sulfitobacter donghicola]|uniref:Lipolytic enzyme n=1 Tax=Sulfitobacter donghicola DSW-25 = KCTC 12864 = JCM 14565 TaxID=1300350 RepID=A0A073IZH7_9RHOB|nr:alpha/beta hydrolase [Sulfitobacter donghicola]KEJ90827.1 lipolytic enzyme [Sulfitobacter donghicola DSW-25 = KCTC 12864 = JCM 14565]KIN68103.1 Lipolytic enzyme [Sulfitobacter donghicola DSW-25 = KCTC 12864 = JCM 14565]